MSNQPDYYVILGVAPNATMVEINKAARALADKFPQNARDPDVNAAYRQLLEAFQVLGHVERRAAYDAARAQRAPELLQVTTQLSRRTVPASDDAQLLYLLTTLHAPEEAAQANLPLNLALVFDRSTSMRDERLAKLKAAARELVDKLSADDILSIVTFSDRAEVVWQASPVEQRERIVSHINQIEASGGTEIYQGLDAAIRELRRAPLRRYVNHVILMTDGQTYGDEEKCLSLAATTAMQGITLSAFGIGADWNDEFLDKLATPSGGRCDYIESPAQIVDYLREEISGLGAVYAHNIRFTLGLPAGVRCQYAFKLSPYSLPLDCQTRPMQLGVLERRAPLSILLELVVSQQREGAELTIAFDFTADIPTANVHAHLFRYEAVVTVGQTAKEVIPPPTVKRAVQMLNLHRLSERAWQEFEAGQTERATKRMTALTTRLLEAGYPELAEQAELERQRLSQMGTLSLEGRKRLKYGTRSLVTKAMKLDSR